MAEEEQNVAEGVHDKLVLPSGLAAEVASSTARQQGDPATFAAWLRDRLGAASVPPDRLAALSGVAPADMARLLDGQPAFPLDVDHLQRLATALIELHVVTNPAQAWEAAGFADSEYIVPPVLIVQTMSGTA